MENFIEVERIEQLSYLLGNLDENKKLLENKYNISITSHSGKLKLSGDAENVEKAARAIKSLIT